MTKYADIVRMQKTADFLWNRYDIYDGEDEITNQDKSVYDGEELNLRRYARAFAAMLDRVRKGEHRPYASDPYVDNAQKHKPVKGMSVMVDRGIDGEEWISYEDYKNRLQDSISKMKHDYDASIVPVLADEFIVHNEDDPAKSRKFINDNTRVSKAQIEFAKRFGKDAPYTYKYSEHFEHTTPKALLGDESYSPYDEVAWDDKLYRKSNETASRLLPALFAKIDSGEIKTPGVYEYFRKKPVAIETYRKLYDKALKAGVFDKDKFNPKDPRHIQMFEDAADLLTSSLIVQKKEEPEFFRQFPAHDKMPANRTMTQLLKAVKKNNKENTR